MCTHLTIDSGNTSVKIVVWVGETPVYQCASPALSRSAVTEVFDRYSPASAIICSVKGNPGVIRDMIVDIAGEGFPVLILGCDTPLPVSLEGYSRGTLGADRIAALAGAHSLFPGCDVLVTDIGTAVTYDLLTGDGRFAGGNIAPGIGMRLRALNHFTARLPLVESKGDTPLLGHDTESAMRAGAMNGVIAEILYYSRILRERGIAPDHILLLTGGWAQDIAERIEFASPVTEPLLVSIGLNRILSYNETETE